MSDYWIQTRSGIKFDLLHPRVDMVSIEDVAFHLAHINRYCGAAGVYSVAQHSIYVCSNTPEELKLEALLHDAAEAYTHDLTSLLKRLLRIKFNPSDYDDIVDNIEAKIASKFDLNISHENKQIIKRVDLKVAKTEKLHLFNKDCEWFENKEEPYDFSIYHIEPRFIVNDFLSQYNYYKRI